jgi:hypothetical protein
MRLLYNRKLPAFLIRFLIQKVQSGIDALITTLGCQ